MNSPSVHSSCPASRIRKGDFLFRKAAHAVGDKMVESGFVLVCHVYVGKIVD